MFAILCKSQSGRKEEGWTFIHSYQRDDDFAIGISLECNIRSEALTKGNMIVNFAVNSQDNFPIVAGQRLGAAVWIDLQA
jgi:hypothetical protein